LALETAQAIVLFGLFVSFVVSRRVTGALGCFRVTSFEHRILVRDSLCYTCGDRLDTPGID